MINAVVVNVDHVGLLGGGVVVMSVGIKDFDAASVNVELDEYDVKYSPGSEQHGAQWYAQRCTDGDDLVTGGAGKAACVGDGVDQAVVNTGEPAAVALILFEFEQLG